MNHLIETEGRVYLLAASAAGGRVAVYGQTPFRGLPFSRTFSATYPLGRGEGPRARSLCLLHAEPNRKFRLPRSPLGAWADPFAVRQRDRYVRKHGEQGKIALSGAGRGLPDVPPSGGRAAAAVSPAVKQIRTIPHSECGD